MILDLTAASCESKDSETYGVKVRQFLVFSLCDVLNLRKNKIIQGIVYNL